MARPTTKADLIEAANLEYQKMNDLINTLTISQQETNFNFEDRDKNIRDVLAHLYHWHHMMDQWYNEGTVHNLIPVVPGEGYTWRTLPQLNLDAWKIYQDVSLQEVKTMLEASHQQMMKYIESHTNDELFSKGIYRWTKGSTLGAYFVSNTSSHYVWAIKKIKKHAKQFKG